MGGVAPGAEEAFEAEGADSDPDEGAGWELGQFGFATAVVAGGLPIRFFEGVGETDLDFVD